MDRAMAESARRERPEGFTLLEVVAAMAILVVFLVPMLAAVSAGLKNIEAIRRRSLALRLAQEKMAELESMPIPDAEGTDDGDFGRDYPDYTWRTEVIKTPDLQLLEATVASLQAMEVHVTVFWEEAGTEKSLRLNTILLE